MDEDERQLESRGEDRTGQVKSPVSGLDSATTAGASVEFTARSLFTRRTHRRVKSELPAYLMIQCSWFTAFGLQMVLFPYLITNRLGLDGTELPNGDGDGVRDSDPTGGTTLSLKGLQRVCE